MLKHGHLLVLWSSLQTSRSFLSPYICSRELELPLHLYAWMSATVSLVMWLCLRRLLKKNHQNCIWSVESVTYSSRTTAIIFWSRKCCCMYFLLFFMRCCSQPPNKKNVVGSLTSTWRRIRLLNVKREEINMCLWPQSYSWHENKCSSGTNFLFWTSVPSRFLS